MTDMPPIPNSNTVSFEDVPDTENLPQPRARIDGWTPQRQKVFLEGLARCGSVKSAAALAGCSRESAYRLKRRPDAIAFSRAWNAALIHARDVYADELMEKGLNGWSETVWHQGEEVGERNKWSAPLFLAALARLDLAANSLDRDDNPAKVAAAQFDDMITRIGEGDKCDDLIAGQDEMASHVKKAQRNPYDDTGDLMAALRQSDALRVIKSTPPEDIDISDLDENEMEDWDDLQWERAYRSGLLNEIDHRDGGGVGEQCHDDEKSMTREGGV